MTDRLLAQIGTPGPESPPRGPSRRSDPRRSDGQASSRRDWLREPKSAVWMALAAIILIGGGRRLHWAWRARKAVGRLSEPGVTSEEIEAVAEYRRSGVWELLRIFSTSESEPLRTAAGRSLARLWKRDELVGEEEQALVRRGFAVTWKARRRYPRSLNAAIPIVVDYDVPFLPDEGDSVRGADLEWSHRIIGARRATLEEFSAWKAGRGAVDFSIIPDDFPTNGPHRLVLQSKVRTTGLSDTWEIELPHVPFQFDFDPVLRLDAILTLSDAVRDEAMARAIRLESATVEAGDVSALLPLGREWVLRNPPRLAVDTPLPSDLAHRAAIEFEGTPGRFPAGSMILSGQGTGQRGEPGLREIRRFDVGPTAMIPEGIITRPGFLRMRLHLEADSQLGWADPDIRSVWPGQVETNWVDAEIIRR
jgi:hypothetical protein